MLTLINPTWRAEPFDHPYWVFGAKFDGFRAAADTVRGRLISRNGNQMQRFEGVLDLLPKDCVFDGEGVVLDDAGRPLFDELLFGRHRPTYVVVDLMAVRCRSSSARWYWRGSASGPRAGLRAPTASLARGGRFTGPWSMLISRALSPSIC